MIDSLQELKFYDDKTFPQDLGKTKNSLHKHLEKANELLQRKENDYYQEVMNRLYEFADEVNRMESEGELTQNNANLLRPQVGIPISEIIRKKKQKQKHNNYIFFDCPEICNLVS